MPRQTAVASEHDWLPAPERRMAELFPIVLKLNGRRAMVVGGGKISTLRIRQLVRAGASVTVIAPKMKAEIEELAKAASMVLNRREFKRADLTKRYFIVVAATNNPAVQKAVFEEAERHGTLCNVVDNPAWGNFYTPAVVERGELKIAISTSGRSPSLAGKLREYLEEAIPENAADLTGTVGLLRSKLRMEIPGDPVAQRKLVREFVEKALKR